MSYLNKLIKDKENNDKYQEEVAQLKQAIFDVSDLHTLHDGLFLDDLLKLVQKWKGKKV